MGGADINDTIGFQEEVGTIQRWVVPEGCVVLSEGWPSWTFALRALGCHDVVTWAVFDSHREKEEFRATGVGKTLVTELELRDLWTRWSRKPHVLIQGSWSFVRKVEEWTRKRGASSVTVVSLSGQEHELTMRTRKRVSHRQVGGLTTGIWDIQSTQDVSKWELPKIKRVLKHVLNA